MPLDKLVQRILADAQDHADGLLNSAKLLRIEMLKETDAEAEKRYDQLVEEARRAAEGEKQKILTVALLDGRRAVLEAKQRIVQDVLDRAIEAVLALPPGKYVRVLSAQLVNVTGGLEWELVLSDRDRERVGEALVTEANKMLEERGSSGRVSLSSDTSEISGGFVLKGEEIEVDCSLEALFDARREDLEEQVIRTMFDKLRWTSQSQGST